MSSLDEEPGQEVSPEVPATSWRSRELVLAVVALVVLLAVIAGLRSRLDVFVHPLRAAGIDTTATGRARRGQLLSDLARAQVVSEVDSAGEWPRLYTGPGFEALGREERLARMHEAYVAFFPTGEERVSAGAGGAMLLVYDGRTRRLIGSYTPSHGLTLEQ